MNNEVNSGELSVWNNDRNNKMPTIQEVQELVNTYDSMVGKITSTIEKVSTSVVEIKTHSARVELETAQIEASLDALMIKAQKDVKLYEISLPLLDKQFTLYQQRMDNLMAKAIDIIGDDFSDNGIARQEAIVKLIELTNDGLNRLMSKLIPQY